MLSETENHVKESNVIFVVIKKCPRRTFILDYTNNGYKPEVKRKISEMAANVGRIRDTARVLKISTSIVISELKKKNH